MKYDPSCECVAGLNDLYHLVCTDGCEACFSGTQACAITTVTYDIDSGGERVHTTSCYDFTKGSYDGNFVCLGMDDNADDADWTVFFNSVECTPTDAQDTACITANCTSTDIEVIVDSCDGTFRDLFAPLSTTTDDEVTVGQCFVGRGDFPGSSSSAVFKKVSSFTIASAASLAALA